MGDGTHKWLELSYVKADLTKVESFVEGSKKASKEFSDIRDEFDRINNTLLS